VAVTAKDKSAPSAAALATTFAREFVNFRRRAERARLLKAQDLVQKRYQALSPQDKASPDGLILRERAQQLRVLASLENGDVDLVQPAKVPGAASYPKPNRDAILGLIAGLLLGIALALIWERLDRRLMSPDEVEELFERPVLGAIPKSRSLARDQQERVLPPDAAEAFRMLRANLRYFNVDREVRSVLITSGAPGDGKSTVSWNLALAAADAGERVLLIEADLRHPSLGANLNGYRGADRGLSVLLSGSESLPNVVVQVPTRQDGQAGSRTMDVLFAGPLPPNPTDLIESRAMENLVKDAESQYDLVVIDTPPTSVVSDAIPLTSKVSGVIIVNRLAKSTRDSATLLKRQLDNLRAPTLGVVINALGGEGRQYGYGYGYGDYGKEGPKPAEQDGEAPDAEQDGEAPDAPEPAISEEAPTPSEDVDDPPSPPERLSAEPAVAMEAPPTRKRRRRRWLGGDSSSY
jgi:capsular exopolysaccharide synthesis family protein